MQALLQPGQKGKQLEFDGMEKLAAAAGLKQEDAEQALDTLEMLQPSNSRRGCITVVGHEGQLKGCAPSQTPSPTAAAHIVTSSVGRTCTPHHHSSSCACCVCVLERMSDRS